MIAYRAAEVLCNCTIQLFRNSIGFCAWLGSFWGIPIDTLFPGVLFIVTAGLVIIWREKINKN